MTPYPSNLLQATVLRAGLLHALAPLADASYALPKLGYLLGPYASWFREALGKLGAADYMPESGDCDDFADLYATLARIAHRRTSGSKGTALAIGVLYYTQDKGGGHAINAAVTPDFGLVFIEPQTGKQVFLSPTELKSATHLRF